MRLPREGQAEAEAMASGLRPGQGGAVGVAGRGCPGADGALMYTVLRQGCMAMCAKRLGSEMWGAWKTTMGDRLCGLRAVSAQESLTVGDVLSIFQQGKLTIRLSGLSGTDDSLGVPLNLTQGFPAGLCCCGTRWRFLAMFS